jgi:hypothetical protein
MLRERIENEIWNLLEELLINEGVVSRNKYWVASALALIIRLSSGKNLADNKFFAGGEVEFYKTMKI